MAGKWWNLSDCLHFLCQVRTFLFCQWIDLYVDKVVSIFTYFRICRQPEMCLSLRQVMSKFYLSTCLQISTCCRLSDQGLGVPRSINAKWKPSHKVLLNKLYWVLFIQTWILHVHVHVSGKNSQILLFLKFFPWNNFCKNFNSLPT